jgi:hypothetical protein
MPMKSANSKVNDKKSGNDCQSKKFGTPNRDDRIIDVAERKKKDRADLTTLCSQIGSISEEGVTSRRI